MCTMLVYRKHGAYVGRNMDIEYGFGEKVVLTPRNYRLPLKRGGEFATDHGMIGMAAVAGNFPLYAEAVNEAGLAMAGLNFPGTAVYHPAMDGRDNITPFELIPWILGQAGTVDEAEALLRKVNLLNVPFGPNMPLAPLHFMVADKTRSIVAEPMEEGLRIYEDPYDVMTNNPPFPYHDWNMRGYRHLGAKSGKETFAPAGEYPLTPYAAGMASMGLPGDPSSASRFVRASFGLVNSESGESEAECVSQVFHVLDSVAMTAGTVITDAGKADITRYSCCMNLGYGTYFYKTYGNSRITKIQPKKQDFLGDSLKIWPLRTEQDFFEEN